MPDQGQKPLTEEEREIIEGWARISTEYRPRELSEEEKGKFQRARFLEEQEKKTKFILGEPLFR